MLEVSWHLLQSASHSHCQSHCRCRRPRRCSNDGSRLGCLCYLTLIWHFNVKCFDQTANNDNMIVNRECVWMDGSMTWAHELITKTLTLNVAVSSTEHNNKHTDEMINKIRFFSFPLVFVASSFTIDNLLRDLIKCNFDGYSQHSRSQITYFLVLLEWWILFHRSIEYTEYLASHSRIVSIEFNTQRDCATISFNTAHTTVYHEANLNS